MALLSLKRHFGIGVGVTGAMLAVLWLGPEASVLSSGPIDKDHDNIACSQCHDRFNSFATNDKCVACHEDNVMLPTTRFASVSCTSCHREHLGRDADLTAVGNDKCARCHQAATVHLQVPVVLSEKLDGLARDCTGCHGSHKEHRQTIEPTLADVRKHLVAAHRSASPLYHKDTCQKCHQDKGVPAGDAVASRQGFFDPHVTHVRRLKIRCTWCHDDIDIRQKSGTRLRRTVATQKCAKCHEGEYYPAKDGS